MGDDFTSRHKARFNLARDTNEEARRVRSEINEYNKEVERWGEGRADEAENQNLWGMLLGGAFTAGCVAAGWFATPICISIAAGISGATRTVVDATGDDWLDQPIERLDLGETKFRQSEYAEIEEDAQELYRKMNTESSFGSEFKTQAIGTLSDAGKFYTLASGMKAFGLGKAAISSEITTLASDVSKVEEAASALKQVEGYTYTDLSYIADANDFSVFDLIKAIIDQG